MIGVFWASGVFASCVGLALRWQLVKLRIEKPRSFVSLFTVPSKEYQLELDPFVGQLVGAMFLALALLFTLTDNWLYASIAGRVVAGLGFVGTPFLGIAIVEHIRKVYAKKP